MSRLKLATMTSYLAVIKVVHHRGDVWVLLGPVPWTTEKVDDWNDWALLDLNQGDIIRVVPWWGLWELPEECSTHTDKRTMSILRGKAMIIRSNGLAGGIVRGKAMIPRSNCLAGAIAG